jgi:hypothetical protein
VIPGVLDPKMRRLCEKVTMRIADPQPQHNLASYKSYVRVRNYREVPQESPEYRSDVPQPTLIDRTSTMIPTTPGTKTGMMS